jgi:hypothetical protein
MEGAKRIRSLTWSTSSVVFVYMFSEPLVYDSISQLPSEWHHAIGSKYDSNWEGNSSAATRGIKGNILNSLCLILIFQIKLSCKTNLSFPLEGGRRNWHIRGRKNQEGWVLQAIEVWRVPKEFGAWRIYWTNQTILYILFNLSVSLDRSLSLSISYQKSCCEKSESRKGATGSDETGLRTDGHSQFRMPEVELTAYFARNPIFQIKLSCIDCLICLSVCLSLSQPKSHKGVSVKEEDEGPTNRDQQRALAETQKALYQEKQTKLMGSAPSYEDDVSSAVFCDCVCVCPSCLCLSSS